MGSIWGPYGVRKLYGVLMESEGPYKASMGSVGFIGPLWGPYGVKGVLWGPDGVRGPLWGFYWAFMGLGGLIGSLCG